MTLTQLVTIAFGKIFVRATTHRFSLKGIERYKHLKIDFIKGTIGGNKLMTVPNPISLLIKLMFIRNFTKSVYFQVFFKYKYINKYNYVSVFLNMYKYI